MLATIQAIIAVQQGMGQGFWLERRGVDDGQEVVGHDAIWIDPAMHIYIDFDSLDALPANKELFDEWKMLLVVHGADRLVIRPDAETMKIVEKWWDKGDSGL